MSSIRKTAKEYYSQSGFKRLLNEIFKKYIGLERAGGKVQLAHLSAEEAETLSGFFGQLLRPGDDLSVPVSKFVQEINRGYKLTIPLLYEVLEGQPLLTRTEQKEYRGQQWALLFHRVNEYAKEKYQMDLLQGSSTDAIFHWFNELRQGQALGCRVLQNVFRQDINKAYEELAYCVDALYYLQKDMETEMQSKGKKFSWIRLPVFATKITDDSHAFDWKRSLGRLFWSALANIESRNLKMEDTFSSESLGALSQLKQTFDEIASMDRRQIYRRAGIKDDDISSDVIVFAQPFTQFSAVSKLTLRQIEMMSVWPEYSALYVVENPSIFSTLVDEAIGILEAKGILFEEVPSDFPIMICSSGQPSDAVILFIRNCLLANTQCKMYYSGDFDLPGIQIAIGMEKRFRDAFLHWHMNSDTYKQYAQKGLVFSEEDKKQLKEIQVRWSSDMGTDMEKRGIKCYHEAIIHELNADWINAVNQALEIK